MIYMEKLEKIDIEKSKELFAYEMTEVLLMLKGEFARVSGKDMRYEQWAVDEKKQELPQVNIPTVALEKSQITLPGVRAPQPVNIPEAKVCACAQAVPAIAAFEKPQLPQISVEAKQVALPQVAPVSGSVNMPQVQTQKVCVSVPAPVAPVAPKGVQAQIEKIELALPNTAAPAQKNVEAVEVKSVQVQIPALPKFQAAAVQTPVVAMPKTPVPQLPRLPQHKQCAVQVCSKSVALPELPTVPAYEPKAVAPVQPLAIDVDVPAVPVLSGPIQCQLECHAMQERAQQVSACLAKLEQAPHFAPVPVSLEEKKVPAPQVCDLKDAIGQFRVSLGI